MMRLSTMQAVIGALEEEETSRFADEIGNLWNADAGSVKFFRASANFVFKFTVVGRDYFLRFNHETERTAESAQSEIEYVNFLAAQGIVVATPMPSVHGSFVESVQTPLGFFHATVFVALRGEQKETEELTPDLFAVWGKALGTLHNASEGYQETGRPTWQDHLLNVAVQLPREEQGALTLQKELQERLSQLPTNVGAYGLIHFDFETDNVIWTEQGLAALDFDESAWYWFVADIAFALRDVFGDDASRVDLSNASLRHFVAGYRQVRLLLEEDLALIPLFLRLHNLLTFAKLFRAIGTERPPDAPLWVENLWNKLVGKMDSYRTSFLKGAV